MHQVEKDRAKETKPASLNLVAFEAAWTAFQNTPIDLVADSDDEQCRCLGAAIEAYNAVSAGGTCACGTHQAAECKQWPFCVRV